MTRTISQIAGEFGLSRGASADPFSQQETAVLGNVQRSLDDIRSQQLESSSARGFGRSSFTEGAFARQTADVVGQVGQQFAQGRTQEALRESDFERGIISQEIGADRASRALTETTAAEQRLIGSRAEAETGLIGARGDVEERLTGVRGAQERLTLADQIAGESGLIGARGEQTRQTQEAQIAGESSLIGTRGQQERQTLADQIAGQSSISSQQAEQRLTELQRQGSIEEGLVGTRGQEQRQNIAAQQQSSQALATTSAEQQRLTLADQAGFAMQQTQENNAAREQLALTSGEQQRLTQAESFIAQGQQIQQQADLRITEANNQFANESKLLDEKFDRIREELPFELQQKAKYEKEVLQTRLEIEREQTIIDTAIQTALSYIVGNLSGTGLEDMIGGLDDIF